MNTARIEIETKKSAKGEKIPERGMIRRGKYTFVIIWEFVTMLVVDRVSPSAKSVQGSSAANTKRGYGTLFDGIFARPPKKKEKMTTIKSGWMITQRKPSAVCL
jgi:hypothetical protein